MKAPISLRRIFTVGHSTTSQDTVVAWLKSHDVDVLLDVRSSPFSRYAPQFNRPALAEWIAFAGMRYVFGGKSLGGRPEDESMYEHGRASYSRMSKSHSFAAALRRLVVLAKAHSVALLCAEPDPLECHRFLLVSRVLHLNGIGVTHILPGGLAEEHADAERRMVRTLGLSQGNLFDVTTDVIRSAYEIQEGRFAFRSAAYANRPHT